MEDGIQFTESLGGLGNENIGGSEGQMEETVYKDRAPDSSTAIA